MTNWSAISDAFQGSTRSTLGWPVGLLKMYGLALRFRNRYLDPVLVPLENRLLNRYAKRYPRRLEEKLERAIDRGLTYFERIENWQLDSLVAFTLFADESHDKRLAMVSSRLAKYQSLWKDPFLRIFDRSYDPETDGKDRPNTYVPEVPHDHLMIKCVYADRRHLGKEFLQELGQLEYNGGYGSTHILMGCALLRQFSSIEPERLDALMQSTIGPILRKQQRSRISDILCEGTAFLQWQGHFNLVQPAWIIRIINGQMADGGWYWKRPPIFPASHQHPSCLAIAALMLYRQSLQTGTTNEAISNASC